MSEQYLTGALSLASYTLPLKRTITVVGEEHSLDLTKCTKFPQIHVSDYVKSRMTANAVLLMEYPTTMALKNVDYSSANMREIRDAIVGMKAENRTFGIDTRRSYIDSDVLYGKKVYKLTYEQLLRSFWEPLRRGSLFSLPDSFMYSKDDYNFLKSYIEAKRKNETWFWEKIIKTLPMRTLVRDAPRHEGVNIVEFFRRLWADISDLQILEIVLKNSPKEYIIVVGYKHAENIRDIFHRFERYYHSADSGFKCIPIEKTI